MEIFRVQDVGYFVVVMLVAVDCGLWGVQMIYVVMKVGFAYFVEGVRVDVVDIFICVIIIGITLKSNSSFAKSPNCPTIFSTHPFASS